MIDVEKLLRDESPCHAKVLVRKGTPRLIVNNQEIAPLAGWSWGLIDAASIYRDAGIQILHPILGLNSVWNEDRSIDFGSFDKLFESLIRNHPKALLLPRVLLEVPDWWEDKHTEDLIGISLPHKTGNIQYGTFRLSDEGGMRWTNPSRSPSLASHRYLADISHVYAAFLEYYESSPFASRIVGYQIGGGIYGEWHYALAEFMPDNSTPASEMLGRIPSLEDRLTTRHGLLRDPEQESDTISYYRRFHRELIAPTILRFARLTKSITNGRVLCGCFYGYLLENVWVQEGGHLAPAQILNAPEIDFFASPYTYQTTNLKNEPWWMHDVVDGAGNFLGRARGVAGDGGYRVLLESLRRHGKLFFVEADAGTFLASPPGDESGENADIDKLLTNIGGVGSQTQAGTIRVLSRDLGRMWAGGSGGWMFDFGAATSIKKSWYDHDSIRKLFHEFAQLFEHRSEMDLTPCAEIAAVYDTESFFYTRHWRAEKPLDETGSFDFFMRWFLDSQARALHRLGAPVDYLYRFDLRPEDFKRYKLIFMVNNFVMDPQEVQYLKDCLPNSGTTVVWVYAPAYLQPEKINLRQMAGLTGFQFDVLTSPGPMMINQSVTQAIGAFGVDQMEHPRFVIRNASEVLGTWIDDSGPAFGKREHQDGWTSIYCGTAPMPASLLRELAGGAGAQLWSSAHDIVVATRDTAMVVATSSGPRTLNFGKEVRDVRDPSRSFTRTTVEVTEGDVMLFASAEL